MSAALCAVFDLADAEVGDLHDRRRFLFDQIGRLDVAMDDSFAVRVHHRFEEALRGGDRVLQRERSFFGQQHIDRCAVDELHHEHGIVFVVDEFVEARDVAMAQLGEDLRLFHEALARGDFAGQFVGHHLEDDRKIGRKNIGRGYGAADVDVTHPAFADLALDPVIADGGSDHFRTPSASHIVPSAQSGTKRKRWPPMRMTSRVVRSRRGSISASFT